MQLAWRYDQTKSRAMPLRWVGPQAVIHNWTGCWLCHAVGLAPWLGWATNNAQKSTWALSSETERVRTPPPQLGEAVICALMLCRAAGLAPCPNGSKLGSEAARGLSPGSLVKQSWRLCSANSQSWGLGTLFGWGHRMRSIARQPFGWGPNRSRTADRVPWPERATAQLCG